MSEGVGVCVCAEGSMRLAVAASSLTRIKDTREFTVTQECSFCAGFEALLCLRQNLFKEDKASLFELCVFVNIC